MLIQRESFSPKVEEIPKVPPLLGSLIETIMFQVAVELMKYKNVTVYFILSLSIFPKINPISLTDVFITSLGDLLFRLSAVASLSS
jgi:hypothetical protein